jgi:hydroxyacylglutathione hydrolase
MKIERFEVPGLAQYSYVLSDAGQAVVIDPVRDIDRYLDYLTKERLHLTYVLETHIHADFAAGSVALAEASGAELAVSAYDKAERYQYAMPHRALADGDSIEVGKMRVEARHTPGHTPEHLSFLLFDLTRSATVPVAMFSGEFLFVGSLGRPDLLGEEAKLDLAHALYRSLHGGIENLPDGLLIYPGHGSGSLCGSGMSEFPETTLGYERATNAFFLFGEEEFVEKVLASVPEMPDYYPRMKELNARGAPALHSLPRAVGLSPEQLMDMMKDAAVTLVDLRPAEAFGGAHVPGSINIGAGQNLSLWAGWLLDSEAPIVLIGEGGDDEEARLALSRVGLDDIAGYLDGGFGAWIAAGLPFSRTIQKTVDEVELQSAALLVLDVRSKHERRTGSIPNSRHVTLGDLLKSVGDLSKDQAIVTVCGSGYRSSVAASLLQREGFSDVSSMDGGMTAWNRRAAQTVG